MQVPAQQVVQSLGLWVGLLVGIQALIGAIVGVFLYLFKMNMDNAMKGYKIEIMKDLEVFKETIIKTIESKLASYLQTERFNDYSKAHSDEHKVIDGEVLRLRDFKHSVVAPTLRDHGAKIDDLKADVSENKARIAAFTELLTTSIDKLKEELKEEIKRDIAMLGNMHKRGE